MASSDPIRARLRAELRSRFGARLDRALLFGSRARGDAGPESDYDVAVVLKGYDGGIDEVLALADLTTDILLETGAFVSAKPFAPHEIEERTLFMHNLRREAVPL